MILVFSGCKSHRVSLAEKGSLSISNQACNHIKIMWADVYQCEGSVYISGALRRVGYSSFPIKTHVDVSIVSAKGKILHEIQGSDFYVPRRSPGKGINFQQFRISLPMVPPESSQVRVVCHSGTHPDNT